MCCHCDNCQRAHGAAWVPRAIFRRDDVKVEAWDVKSWHNRLRTMVIGGSCGSHLFGEHQSSPFRGVNAGSFPKGRFKRTPHIYCQHALAKVADDLPHHADIPSEHGGSGKLMSW